MEDSAQKRNLFCLSQTWKIRPLPEIIGLLILFTIKASFTFANPFPDSWYADNNSISTLYNQNQEDVWDASAVIHYHFHIGEGFVTASILGDYESLGEFQAVESEDYAYKDVSTVSGRKTEWKCHAAYHFRDYSLGGYGGMSRESVDNFYSSDNFIWGLTGKIGFFSGIIKGEADFSGPDWSASMVYTWQGYFNKAGLELSAGMEYVNQPILHPEVKILNSKKDLSLALSYRQGTQFDVYDPLTIELWKKFGNFDCRVYFSPSVTGRNLYGIQATYAWDDGKAKDDYY